MQQWWIGAATAVVAALGYLAKRWLERRGRAEGLNCRLQALALIRGMKREGISMKELEQVERDAARDG